MPRKRPKQDETPMDAPMLMLPAPRTPHKHGAHEKDPYATLPGSVPGRATNERIVKSTPIERELTEPERAQQLLLQNEVVVKGARYNAWLDALIKHGGEKILALCDVFGIEEDVARANQLSLEMQVREGQGATDVGELLEQNDLGLAMQVHILRGWALSPNAAASINALKIVNEMQGDTRDQGSFEAFLRLSKLQTGKA